MGHRFLLTAIAPAMLFGAGAQRPEQTQPVSAVRPGRDATLRAGVDDRLLEHLRRDTTTSCSTTPRSSCSIPTARTRGN